MRRGALSVLVSVVALGAAGCAGGDATKKQLGDLELQVSRLKADVAVLSDRLDLASRNRQAAREEAPKPAAAVVPAVDDDRPPLDVVTLAPEPPPKPPAAAPAPAKPEVNPVLRNTAVGGIEARDGHKATLYDSGKKPIGGYKK